MDAHQKTLLFEIKIKPQNTSKYTVFQGNQPPERQHRSPSKNKVQNRGAFLAAKKFIASSPPQPRIPPQTHHQNTTPKHPLFPKHPSKTPQNQKTNHLPPPTKKIQKQ
jgi:hypothetical protein